AGAARRFDFEAGAAGLSHQRSVHSLRRTHRADFVAALDVNLVDFQAHLSSGSPALFGFECPPYWVGAERDAAMNLMEPMAAPVVSETPEQRPYFEIANLEIPIILEGLPKGLEVL